MTGGKVVGWGAAAAMVCVVGAMLLVPVAVRSADESTSPEVQSAWRAARQYVRALRTGDGERLCGLSTEDVRGRLDGPCVAGVLGLAGPTPKVLRPVTDDGRATAVVRRAPAPTLTLVMRREAGGWRVADLRGR